MNFRAFVAWYVLPCFVSSSAIVRALFLFYFRERISFLNGKQSALPRPIFYLAKKSRDMERVCSPVYDKNLRKKIRLLYEARFSA